MASKSNEKTSIPALLKVLELTHTVMGIDAVAGQLSNAELIVERKEHDLLALTKNQLLLYEQVSQRTQQTKSQLLVDEHIDFGIRRIETRHCYVEAEFIG